MKLDTLIIGAGPAGLTAGYLLTKSGTSVGIIEADPDYVGGISRTVRYKGFLFDIGGHRFFSKSREVVDLWNEILPDGFMERPRLSRIFYGQKFYSYPLRAFEALKNLGFYTSVACLLSYAWARVRPVRCPRTFHEWVRNEFGEMLFDIFFRTYTEKVWGMSCDEISADWASQRIKGLSLSKAVLNGLERSLRGSLGSAAPRRDRGGAKTLIESFRYPRKGPGMMWEAAAQRIREQGGAILMGRSLVSLEWDAATKLWSVTAVTRTGEHEVYEARHVISSAAITDLCDALIPVPASRACAHSLRYRDFITVALIVEADATFPDNWVYIHDPGVRVGRVQNFLSWSPDMAPEGFACLGLEYFCSVGDDLWDLSDDDLIALATREIGRIGLIDPGKVIDAAVVRQLKAYPVYDETYQSHVRTVRAELEAAYPTLHMVGRNGMHKYNNQDHAMMTAMLSVQNILAGERVFDVWQVNEDAEYSEAGLSGARTALSSERLVPKHV